MTRAGEEGIQRGGKGENGLIERLTPLKEYHRWFEFALESIF
jgi:hypothetical protein